MSNDDRVTPDLEDARKALALECGRSGVAATARRLGVPRNTLLSFLAGTPVRRGTIALVLTRLQERGRVAAAR